MADEPENPTPQEPDPESSEIPPAGDEGKGALSPQDEIDALINGDEGQASPKADNDPSAEEPAKSDELLSQADIDAAMGAALGAAEDAAEPVADVPADTGTFDQSDIDALMNAAGALGDDAGSTGEFSQADIDAAFEASAPAEPPVEARLDSAGKPFDEEAAAMAAALAEAAAEVETPAAPASNGPVPQPVDLPDFSGGTAAGDGQDISILRDVNLRVQIELGRTHMYIEDVLKLAEGSVVELDNLAGDPVDIVVNGRLVARGEVLVLSDNFCVRISEIVTGAQNVAVA